MSVFAPLLEATRRALAQLRALQRDRLLAPIDRETTAILSAAFKAEGAEALRLLASYRRLFATIEADTKRDADRLLAAVGAAEQKRLKALAAKIAPQLLKAMRAAHTASAARLHVQASFDVAHPRAVAWAERHAAELVKGVDDATLDRVRTIISRAIENGQAYSKTEAELKALYDGFRATTPYNAPKGITRYPAHITSRAQLIAVQESAVAYGQADLELGRWMEAGGVAMEKSWLTVSDERTCEVCTGNEGEGWIPFGNPFGDGSEWVPGHVACRCCGEQQRVGATT